MRAIGLSSKLRCCITVVLALTALPLLAATAQDISYLTEDYPPSNFVEDGAVRGYAVDLLKSIWRHMNVPEQRIEVVSWARGLNMVETRPDTMLFAMTRTHERDARFQWVGPIATHDYALVGRTTQPIKVRSVRDAKGHRIGVMRQDVGHRILLELGFDDSQLEKAADIKHLLRLLKADRIDLICVSTEVLATQTHQEGFRAKELTPRLYLRKTPFYYAFSKDTDPALVQQFQRALQELDTERRQILKRYGVN